MRSIGAIVILATLAGCAEDVSPRAERVFYRTDGMAAWGTVCKLNRRGFLGMGERGYVSVAHVTENGTPVVGPKDAATASDALSDWSFLGIDPMTLDAADYPVPKAGEAVMIHGFPARDRDGEVIPGTLYSDDPVPPFWWVELHDSDDGIAAEGVIGGISGSCVFDGDGALVAVVHANGFSRIEGTTNTWAKVIPVRAAIQQAQGRRGETETVTASRAEPLPPAEPVAPVTANVVPPPAPVIVETYALPSPAPAGTPRYVDVSETSSAIGPIEIQPLPRQVIAPSAYRTVRPAPPPAARPAPVPPPVQRQIIPAPRGSYRLRGAECGHCI